MYLYIFGWLFLIGIIGNSLGIYKIQYIDEKVEYRCGIIAAIVLFFPVFWLACMGTPVNDVPVYIASFNQLPSEIGEFISYLYQLDSGKGFAVLEWIIKIIFGNNVTAFRIIIALIHSIPIIIIFRKYSENYWISIYMFVASACHISWMMNGLRQFIAVAIILATLPLMIKKKYVSVIVIVLIAATIHTSAILMLPIVIIGTGRAWHKKSIFLIIVVILLISFLARNLSVVDNILEGSNYTGAYTNLVATGDDGMNPIRVIVSSIPMILAFLCRRNFYNDNEPLINICVNMSIITVGLNVIAMFTSGILMGRLGIYTRLYGFLIMPFLIKNTFTKQSQKIVIALLIVLYFVYYCVEVGSI